MVPELPSNDRIARHLALILHRLEQALAQGELENATLIGGQAGTALLFAYASQLPDGQRYLLARDHCLNFIFEALGSKRLNGSLYTGITGIAWVFQHLRQTGMLASDDLDADFFAELEPAISQALQQASAKRDYDLLEGILGQGLYFLEAQPWPATPRPEVGLVAAQLLAWAEQDAAGLHWPTDKWVPTAAGEYDTLSTVDFGLAHGMPSIVWFLAEAYHRGVLPAAIAPALTKSCAWLLQYALPEADFSFGVDAHDACYQATGEARPASRLAWCYGDLSVAFALLKAGACLGDSGLWHQAVAVAAKSARRRLEGSQIRDAAFCHGASGLAYMYRQLHRHCGGEEFATASAYWLEQALTIMEADDEFGGYFALFKNTQTDELRKRLELGLLEGATGIGLVLLSFLTGAESPWERLFLLDLPAQPAPAAPAPSAGVSALTTLHASV